MNNSIRYHQVYKTVFNVEDQSLGAEFKYQSHPNWDSLGHMTLIAALESEFGINIDMDDVIDLDSFIKGIEILKKYGVIIS